MNAKELAIAFNALCIEHGANPGDAAKAYVSCLGAMIGTAALSEIDLLNGISIAGKDIRNIAVKAWEFKQRGMRHG